MIGWEARRSAEQARLERAAWSITITPARPEQVFTLLADPAQHASLDGTGSIKAVVAAPPRLDLGARFNIVEAAHLAGQAQRLRP